MSVLTADQLRVAIDAAINPLGGEPKVKGPALNTLLHHLAEALPAAAAGGLAVLPELRVPEAGPQTLALPAGATAVLSLLVREAATGRVRPLYPTEYAVVADGLSVAASAGLQANDYLSGSYTTQLPSTPAAGYPATPPPVVVPPTTPPVAPPAPAPLVLPNLVRERVAQFEVGPGRAVQAYEITLDGGASWQRATSTRLPVPVAGVAADHLGVRLAADAAGVPASAVTFLPLTPAVWYAPGLRARYYVGMWGVDYTFFAGRAPFYEQVAQQSARFHDPFFDAFTQLIGRIDYFSVLFDGFFLIKEAGMYRFTSVADDSSATWLGDALASPSYDNRAEAASDGLYLEAGLHPIRMAFGQYTGPKYVDYNCNGMDLSGPIPAERLLLYSNTPPASTG